MQILVDADACPVVSIVERVAKEHNLPVTLLCDTNHVLSSDYSEVIVVGAEADAVDYKLISICHRGDIVVSQDYGVAAMALGKAAYAIRELEKIEMVRRNGRHYKLDHAVTKTQKLILNSFGLDETDIKKSAEEYGKLLNSSQSYINKEAPEDGEEEDNRGN